MKAQTLFADGFDNAILGLAHEWVDVPRVVYSKSKMIDCLTKEGMSFEDAVEYLEFNVWGAYIGKGTPIYSDDLNGNARNGVEELLEMMTSSDDAD